MSGRTYSDRVMRFRRGVYAARGVISPGCQVLLLRLSDGMDAKGIVSIPRSKLAEEFGCPPARITEWINKAKAANFLDTVKRGRPGTTAVYQGLVVVRPAVPSEVREGVPLDGTDFENQAEVREGVPPNRPAWYAQHPPPSSGSDRSSRRGRLDERAGTRQRRDDEMSAQNPQTRAHCETKTAAIPPHRSQLLPRPPGWPLGSSQEEDKDRRRLPRSIYGFFHTSARGLLWTI